VLEVTEIPDLPLYSTVAAEKMSESGPFGGHGAVYRRVGWSLTGCEPPADTRVPVSCRTVMG
jgi:nitrogen fixation protein